MKLYFNSLLVATNADPVAFAASQNGKFNFLGKLGIPDVGGLEGDMDEMRIWQRERTVEEIRSTKSAFKQQPLQPDFCTTQKA